MASELQHTAQRTWQRFLEGVEPLRTELYRYCRYLTRSPWDAEDLAQDALARAFVTLAQMSEDPQHPRAWLFRIASNLWIDQLRRRRELPAPLPDSSVAPAAEPRDAREAAGTLLVKLSPQERAALVLKDAFELTLEEVAETLGTSSGAVKAALHRARGKLVSDDVAQPDEAAQPQARPVPGALDADLLIDLAGELQLPVRVNGQRWWPK